MDKIDFFFHWKYCAMGNRFWKSPKFEMLNAQFRRQLSGGKVFTFWSLTSQFNFAVDSTATVFCTLIWKQWFLKVKTFLLPTVRIIISISSHSTWTVNSHNTHYKTAIIDRRLWTGQLILPCEMKFLFTGWSEANNSLYYGTWLNNGIMGDNIRFHAFNANLKR